MTSSLTEVWTALKAVSTDAIVNGVMTLVGAFVGAMLAFLLQAYALRRQEKRASLMATHRILFCLLQQVNTIVLIQRDFVWPFIKSPVRYLEIPAVQEFDTKKDLFDFNTFNFMLESRESRRILYDLFMAQENYVEALRIFNERSRMHRSDVQPRLAQAGFQSGHPVAITDIEAALGMLVLLSIRNTTDLSVEALGRAYTKLMHSKTEFRKYAVTRFRTNDFTEFEFPDDYGLMAKAS